MRRILLPLLASLPAFAQSAPDADRHALDTLLKEVHELRIAIDRSTLLGTRTQIALQRMQIQETRTTHLAQDLDSTHRQAEEVALNRTRLAARAKDLEEQGPQSADPRFRRDMEEQAKQLKIAMETATAQEQRLRAREAELTSQLQLEQGRLQDLYSRIDEMERALDTAIRQITGKQ